MGVTADELVEALRRCVDSLDDLILGCSDPGTEALGCVWEAREMVRQADRASGKTTEPFQPQRTRMEIRAAEIEKGDVLWFGPSTGSVEDFYRDDFDEHLFVELEGFHWPLEIPVDARVLVERVPADRPE